MVLEEREGCGLVLGKNAELIWSEVERVKDERINELTDEWTQGIY